MSLVTFESQFFAGIDVGQVNDPTALAILERVRCVPRKDLHFGLREQAAEQAREVPQRLDLRHLERLPLGTKYPKQIEIVQRRITNPRLSGIRSFLDMTGCGRPVFDMFKDADLRDLAGVMITGARGESTVQPYGFNVGKSELVTAVQVEMQTDRLRFAKDMPEVATLVRELKEFQAVINKSGNTIFNAREGQHDDLVLAVALAVFGALRPTPVTHLQVEFAS